MWFSDDRRAGSNRYGNRRLVNARQPILMVSARASDERRLRRQKTAAVAVILAAVVGTAWAVKIGADRVSERLWVQNERFVLEHLIVRSDGRLRAEHVRDFGKVREGMGLFAFSLSELKKHLMDIPLVESVNLERRLPDTLVVDIRERVPVARVQSAGTRYPLLVDTNGFLMPPSAQDGGLPLIVVAGNESLQPGAVLEYPGIRAAVALVQLCEAPQYSRILRPSKVTLSSSYYMDVRFAGGERVLMPYEQIESKLKHACEIIKRSADMGQAVAELDMTVKQNYPVKYR